MQTNQVKKTSFLTILFLLLFCSAFSQKTIKGRITNDENIPSGLPGATVRIQSTGLSTVTDANGNYALTVPDSLLNKKLVILVDRDGFASRQVELGNKFFQSEQSLDLQLGEIRLMSGNPSPEDRIPAFPWPPPAFSSQAVIKKDYFTGLGKLSDIDKKLTRALSSLGYSDLSYYYIDGGYALVTKIEQIKADGTTFNAPERWSARTTTGELNWKNYFRSLIFPQQGYFRIIVFAITDKAFTSSGSTVSRSTAQNWLNEGLNILPSSIGGKVWSNSHNCTVLIYQFVKPETSDAKLLTDGPSAGEHLEKSRILNALKR